MSTLDSTMHRNLTVSLLLLVVVSVIGIQNKYCQLSCDYVVKTFTHTVCDRQEKKCGQDQRCGPDFKIVQFSDEQREAILKLHNSLRNQVAIGNETRGNQPPAANMNVLNYNRELEIIAQCWANTCNGNPLIHDFCRRTQKYEHVGQNLGYINSSSANISIETAIDQFITLWYDEVALFQNDWVNDTRHRGQKVGHYTQMIWADTREVGCAATFYTSFLLNTTWNQVVFVCNYGPGGNYLGLPVYEVGVSASKCLGDKRSEEYAGLCGSVGRVNESERSYDIFGIAS